MRIRARLLETNVLCVHVVGGAAHLGTLLGQVAARKSGTSWMLCRAQSTKRPSVGASSPVGANLSICQLVLKCFAVCTGGREHMSRSDTNVGHDGHGYLLLQWW